MLTKLASGTLVLVLAVFMWNCTGAGHRADAPDLQGTERLQIVGPGIDTLSITNSDTIKALLAFVNKRRSGWEVPWGGVPVPRVSVIFYSRSGFQGHFGVGQGFFETDRVPPFASRPAQDREIREFLDLIGVDKKVLK